MSLSRQLLKKSDAKFGDIVDIAPANLEAKDLDLQVTAYWPNVLMTLKRVI